MSDHELRVSKIRNGTVIDHVSGGHALNVLSILGIDGSEGLGVSVVMNVPSDRLGRKDVVKVEDRELSQSEVDVISLIAPEATINIIREFEVVQKNRVDRPETVVGAAVVSQPQLHHQRKRAGRNQLYGGRRRRAVYLLQHDHPRLAGRPH